MTEEPRLEKAATNLMKILDEQVLKSLIRFGDLDASVLQEAEQFLHEQPQPHEFEHATKEARAKVEHSLYQWIEATDLWLHRVSSEGSN